MTDPITINAHSSIRLALGEVLYFDPFHIQKETKDADIIFVTHDHYDHFSPEDIEKILKEDTVFVAPQSTVALIETRFSWPKDQIVTVKPGSKVVVKGLPVEAVAAYNPNKHFHPKKEGWVGYVVTVEGVRYYVCGDMDSNKEGRQVSCDVLLVPCGGTYTMDVQEAAEFTGVLAPKFAIPTHYGDIVGDLSNGSAFAEAVKKTSPDTKVVIKIEP